jgi:hypothetical protein
MEMELFFIILVWNERDGIPTENTHNIYYYDISLLPLKVIIGSLSYTLLEN